MMNGSELLYLSREQSSPDFGEIFFTFDIVSLRSTFIIDTICYCKKRNIILYKIVVKKGKREWNIERRYSEIVKLFPKLKLSKYFDFKVIPSRTYLDVSYDEKYLQNRKSNLIMALESALKDLSSQGSQALTSSEIMNFLLIKVTPSYISHGVSPLKVCFISTTFTAITSNETYIIYIYK